MLKGKTYHAFVLLFNKESDLHELLIGMRNLTPFHFFMCWAGSRAGAWLEGEGEEVSPALFQKLEKSVLIWGKNALIVVIYG